MINLLRYREWAAPRDGERLTSSATCRYAQAVLPILALASPRPGYKCHPHADCGTTRRMIEVLRFVVGLAADVVRRRAGLVAENALLRQQLIVAQRKIAGRVRWAPWQRFTMGLAARLAPVWRDATLLVQPATILRWHQAGCRAQDPPRSDAARRSALARKGKTQTGSRGIGPPCRPMEGRAEARCSIDLPTGKAHPEGVA